MNDDTLHLPKRRLCWHCNNPLSKKPGTDEVFSVTILTRDGHPVKVHQVCEEKARESQRTLTVDLPEALKDHGSSYVVPRFGEGSMGLMVDSKAKPRRKK